MYLNKVKGLKFYVKKDKRKVTIPIGNNQNEDFILVNYLNIERLRIKRELAVALGTMFPQKTFTPIDTMLRNVNWEKYKTIQEGFIRLEEI